MLSLHHSTLHEHTGAHAHLLFSVRLLTVWHFVHRAGGRGASPPSRRRRLSRLPCPGLRLSFWRLCFPLCVRLCRPATGSCDPLPLFRRPDAPPPESPIAPRPPFTVRPSPPGLVLSAPARAGTVGAAPLAARTRCGIAGRGGCALGWRWRGRAARAVPGPRTRVHHFPPTLVEHFCLWRSAGRGATGGACCFAVARTIAVARVARRLPLQPAEASATPRPLLPVRSHLPLPELPRLKPRTPIEKGTTPSSQRKLTSLLQLRANAAPLREAGLVCERTAPPGYEGCRGLPPCTLSGPRTQALLRLTSLTPPPRKKKKPTALRVVHGAASACPSFPRCGVALSCTPTRLLGPLSPLPFL